MGGGAHRCNQANQRPLLACFPSLELADLPFPADEPPVFSALASLFPERLESWVFSDWLLDLSLLFPLVGMVGDSCDAAIVRLKPLGTWRARSDGIEGVTSVAWPVPLGPSGVRPTCVTELGARYPCDTAQVGDSIAAPAVTRRRHPANAHSLNEKDQPGRTGTTPDELREQASSHCQWQGAPQLRRTRARPKVRCVHEADCLPTRRRPLLSLPVID